MIGKKDMLPNFKKHSSKSWTRNERESLPRSIYNLKALSQSPEVSLSPGKIRVAAESAHDGWLELIHSNIYQQEDRSALLAEYLGAIRGILTKVLNADSSRGNRSKIRIKFYGDLSETLFRDGLGGAQRKLEGYVFRSRSSPSRANRKNPLRHSIVPSYSSRTTVI